MASADVPICRWRMLRRDKREKSSEEKTDRWSQAIIIIVKSGDRMDLISCSTDLSYPRHSICVSFYLSIYLCVLWRHGALGSTVASVYYSVHQE